MANARALSKRRKSIRNIKKITRTMELIATGRYRAAMDRALAATAFTKRMTQLVADLAATGLKVSHPLLEKREKTENAIMLVLTANRGLCGGYNGNVLRLAQLRYAELKETVPNIQLYVSGRRGLSGLKFRKINVDRSFTHFEDKPTYAEAESLADEFLDLYIKGKLDRLDVVYTRFESTSKQYAVAETLLPLGSLGETATPSTESKSDSIYEFMPSAESILQEVVPASFKVRLFKCLLDAAVSEQVARMIAMKAATENANDIIKQLSMTYNRARQSQITTEIMDIIGGAEALKS